MRCFAAPRRLAREATAAEQAQGGQELSDRIGCSPSHAGATLPAAFDLPTDVAPERISEALWRLDDTIREIRDLVFGGMPTMSRGRTAAMRGMRPRPARGQLCWGG